MERHVFRIRGLCAAVMAVAFETAMPLYAAVTVLDFETDDECAAITKRNDVGANAAAPFQICITNRFATSGGHALWYRCSPWRNGMPKWPAFTVKPSVADWRGYDRLVMDVVSIGEPGNPDGGDLVGLWVMDPKGDRRNRFYGSVIIPPKGHARLMVNLKEPQGKIDLANITSLHFTTQMPDGFAVAIDRLTLLSPGEEPPPPDGPQVGRDIAPLVEAGRVWRERRDHERHEAREAKRRALLDAAYAAGCVVSPDMILGTATSMEGVRPRDDFTARPIPADGLSLRLARNETESLQLLVSPLAEDLRGVRVFVVGDLLSVGGEAALPAHCVACHPVGYVEITNRTPYSIGRSVPCAAAPGYVRVGRRPTPGWWPDPILDHLDAVDVRGSDMQSFWVRVRCQEGQPAGIYRGALVVSADNAAPVEIPFAVRVNDFALGRTSALPLAISFWPGVSSTRKEYDKDWEVKMAAIKADPDAPVNAWWRHEREWVSFMADYLIPAISLYNYDSLCKDGSRPTEEFCLRGLRQLKDEGRVGFVNIGYWDAFYKGQSVESWRKNHVERLRRFLDAAKEMGEESRAYTYGCDEVTADNFPRVAKAVEELKKEFPGVPVFTTSVDKDFGVGTKLSGIDWFCPLTEDYDVRKADAARAEGRKVWWYICCEPLAPYANMFVECQPIEGRSLMGAQSVKFHTDGFLYYQIANWSTPRCIEFGPFTDWDPQSYLNFNGDGSWTRAGPDGIPLPTIRLENFRDGLEDYAYAKLLEQKLKELGGDCSQMTTNVNCSQIANINKNLPPPETPPLQEAKPTAPRQPSNGQTVKPSNRASWAQRARAALAVPREVVDTIANFSGDPAVLYRWRDEMADLIEEAP